MPSLLLKGCSTILKLIIDTYLDHLDTYLYMLSDEQSLIFK